jgi:type II secretory pathway component PulF
MGYTYFPMWTKLNLCENFDADPLSSFGRLADNTRRNWRTEDLTHVSHFLYSLWRNAYQLQRLFDVCAVQDGSSGYASDLIQEMTASNLGRPPVILLYVFPSFTQTFKRGDGILPAVKPWLLPSRSLTVYYWVIVLPFDAVYFELLTV